MVDYEVSSQKLLELLRIKLMPGSSLLKRRSKPKLEPISYEEMLGTAGMSGFVSFLEVTPSEGAHALRGEREPAAPVETASLPPNTLDKPTPGDYLLPITARPEREGSETGTPTRGIPDSGETAGVSAQVIRVLPDVLVASGIPEQGIPDSAWMGSTAQSGPRAPEVPATIRYTCNRYT